MKTLVPALLFLSFAFMNCFSSEKRVADFKFVSASPGSYLLYPVNRLNQEIFGNYKVKLPLQLMWFNVTESYFMDAAEYPLQGKINRYQIEEMIRLKELMDSSRLGSIIASSILFPAGSVFLGLGIFVFAWYGLGNYAFIGGLLLAVLGTACFIPAIVSLIIAGVNLYRYKTAKNELMLKMNFILKNAESGGSLKMDFFRYAFN